MNDVYILGYNRTPICSYLGKLKSLSAIQLGEISVKGLLDKLNLEPKNIDLVYYGNVLSSGLGQNVARQISYNIGINVPSITVNRVCSSGMESIRQGFNSIKIGEADCVLVGGCESMSNSPYINTNIKSGNKMGNFEIKDSMINDGLIDPFSKKHMGEITEDLCEEYNISRNEIDEYAIKSYLKSRNAIENNVFLDEIQNINIIEKKNENIVSEDEEINKIEDTKKLYKLKPVFKKDGVITAGNSSKLSDGASSMILVSKYFLDKYKLNPLAKIISFDICVSEPRYFPISPIASIKNLLEKNNINKNDIDFYEINEAFACVPILASKEIGIDFEKINKYGGAISVGHPLGCSGCRIVGTLLNVLKKNNKTTGCASICNGGGGATSILIEKL